MLYYVSDDPNSLGLKTEAESPKEAAMAASLDGLKAGDRLTVRWDVKVRPGESDWWFASVTTVPVDWLEAPKKATRKTTRKKAEADED